MIRFLANAAVVVVAGTFSTLIGSRLLGIRRGWVRQLLAGVIGWVLALGVAAGLLDWDPDAGPIVAYTAVLAVPATMALMVLFDLIARPGTLATGDRAGLIQASSPLSELRARVAPLARYRELLAILRRHQLLGHLNGRADVAAGDADPPPVRLRQALEEAGGVYVKLGQIAATRIDLLSPALCEELGTLQSRSAPVPAEQIRSVLESEYGQRVEDVFARFDWEPLAAASIGQTHTASLATGEEVVVKVQRPGVDETIDRKSVV